MSTTVQITTPFAFDGTRTPIDTVRTDGVVNMTQGYTADYSRALGADPAAKAVDRDRFNWLMYLVTANGQDWQLHGLPQWLAQGQYEIGSLVRYTPGTVAEKLYRCTATPPVGSVPTNTQYWEEVMDNTTIQALVPMPYRGQIAVATNFNTLSTNGTWVFNSAAVVSGSANSPSGAGAGMLETRLTGAADGTAIQRYTGINGSIYLRGRTGTNTWSEWATTNFPVSIAQGGTGATTAADARTNLGLGTAAVRNIGTTGDTVPLFSGINTWTGEQIFRSSGGTRVQGFGGANNYGRMYFGTGAAFLEYDAAKFAVGNPLNGEYTIIAGGGTTWTSGNMNPVSKAGDTMTGALGLANAGQALAFGGTGAGQRYYFSYSDTSLVLNTNNTDGSFLRAICTWNRTSGAMTSNAAVGIINPAQALSFGGTAAEQRYYFTYNDTSLSLNTCNLTGGYIGTAFSVNRTTFALNSTGGFDVGSSRKLKDIEGPLPYGLAEVRRIATLIGRYKPEYNSDGRRRLFFDAEQFLEVMPEAVDSEGVEFNGERVPTIKLDQVTPPAYRAIAELADLVDQLRAEIDALKAAR
jgi:hypothetical protein